MKQRLNPKGIYNYYVVRLLLLLVLILLTLLPQKGLQSFVVFCSFFFD